MPLFLASLFGSLVDFFAKYFTKKVAMGSAAIATFAIMTLAFAGLINTLITGVLIAAPASCGVVFLIPDNAPYLVSSMASAYLARFAYDWHRENLRLVSYIT